ncbi:hypothetical protein ACWXVJ_00220 [Mycoplasma sp. 773]
MNKDFNTYYMTLVYKIGNGDLMYKSDNSRLGNKNDKDQIKHDKNIESKTNVELSTPDLMSLLPDKDGNFTEISFSPTLGWKDIKSEKILKNKKIYWCTYKSNYWSLYLYYV